MKDIVYITNIKDPNRIDRSSPYEYSIKSWSKWCKNNNAELVILDEYIFEKDYMKPNWYKLYVFDLLEESGVDYNQIAVVDADTIVHPDCPNFFEMSENKFCAVHNDGSYDWVCRSIENYSKHLFEGFKFPVSSYINSGFLILNKNHKEFYKYIIDVYHENKDSIIKLQDTYGVGTDQPMINFFLHKENIDVKLLPYQFNMQEMARKEILTEDLLFTKLGWIYHYNGIPNNENSTQTLHWMKKTYEHFYGELND